MYFGISLAPNDDGIYDLHLDAKGALATVDGTEAIGQHIRQRLKTYQGEWFLDVRVGVPWLDQILGYRFDPTLAEAVVKAEILSTPGVTEILSFSVKFDTVTRNLTAYAITVLTIYDTEVSI